MEIIVQSIPEKNMVVEFHFSILKKCKSKFDSLVFEMIFINELRPSLNVQSDSLRAKVFK